MSSEIEHGPKPKASPQIQSANNHLDASLTEDDRREVQSDRELHHESPLLVKELRSRNILINPRFRKRKNTKGKQVKE